MPSSTSNSDIRRPRGRWGRTWTLALALVALGLGAWEGFWRLRGFRPQVQSVDAGWHLAFASIEPDSFVVAGTSRIQAALDPEVWVREFGGPAPVQLSLPGMDPLPVLEFLAGDATFRGRVLVEVLPLHAFDASGDSSRRVASLIGGHEAFMTSPARVAESWLEVHGLASVAFRDPSMLLPRLAVDAARGRVPDPNLAQLRPDRFCPLDFRRVGLPAEWSPERGLPGLRHRIAREHGRPADETEGDAIVERYEAATATIVARGGKVLVLHLPACGERREIEEARYPLGHDWMSLASALPESILDAEGVPGLSGYDCFDGSHLDQADSTAFTAALAAAVQRATGN